MKKVMISCACLAVAGLLASADLSYAQSQQGQGSQSGWCPGYGAGAQGSGQQYRQGRGPGNTNSPNYQQGRVCDGTGPKGYRGGGKRGGWGSGNTGTGQTGGSQ